MHKANQAQVKKKGTQKFWRWTQHTYTILKTLEPLWSLLATNIQQQAKGPRNIKV